VSHDSIFQPVKVLEIRLIQNNRSIRAFADIQVGAWIVRDFRVIKQNGQKAFVSPPQVSWKDPETGAIKYKGILTIPPEQKQGIDTEILHAYQEEMGKINGNKQS
jgi:DNA-binding cell septation regulator SpoVG